MFKINIGDKIFYAEKGDILSDVLIKNKIAVDHPCGGRGICQKCKVTVNGKQQLSCKYKIDSDISVTLPEAGNILSETGAIQTGKITENICYVLDIGTTTLALAAVSSDEQKTVRFETSVNPQRAYGADIMSRIEYCRENSPEPLNSVLIDEINRMIKKFSLPTVDKMFVAGNTTMLHLFFNVDCSSMGIAPYTPVFLESKTADAHSMGLDGIKTVISLPSVSSFVGADIVAGMNYIGLPGEGKYNLLIDLGTNAEIVLFSQKISLAAAAAAGPCFEGANISCGMSATDGAIYAFKFGKNGEKKISTVSGKPAKGICGTGLIDIISELLKAGIIDQTGYMEDEFFDLENGITLSQEDIRKFQLAKSAIYSAILSLIKTQVVSFDEISQMYISGGFSAKINIENAVRCGLLPKELSTKTIALNNSSLLGSIKFANEANDLSVYIKNSKYIDLSSNAFFTDLFVRNMMFTDN